MTLSIGLTFNVSVFGDNHTFVVQSIDGTGLVTKNTTLEVIDLTEESDEGDTETQATEGVE